MKRWLTVLLLSGLGAATAAAQPTGTGAGQPAAPDVAEAFADAGKKALKEEDFAKALKFFDQALAAFPDPKYFNYKAVAYEGLGQLLAAAAEYERYLSSQAIEPTRAKDARDALRDLDKHLGKLRITVVGPTGAELSIGGAAWGPVPAAPVRILPGAYEVRARGAGHPTPVVVTGRVEAGKVVDVKVDVTPPTPAQLMDALLADGAALAAAGDHAAVIARFSAAYDENKEPRLIPGLAAAHAALGHDLEAAGWCERYLAGQPRDPVVEEAVRTQLAAVDARLGHLAIVAAGVDGVEIQIGEGAWIALPPQPIRVRPGAYEVRARTATTVTGATGTVAAGETRDVEFTLRAPEALPAAEVQQSRVTPPKRRFSRWSTSAQLIADIAAPGARGSLGLGFDATSRVRLGVDAIVGAGPGLAPTATLFPLGTRLRPTVQLALPVRWMTSREGCDQDCMDQLYGPCSGAEHDGPEPAWYVGGGLDWRVTPRVALTVAVGYDRRTSSRCVTSNDDELVRRSAWTQRLGISLRL